MTYQKDNIPDDLLEALLENPYECLILVDDKGIVRFMSREHEGFYSVSVKEAVGKHITEIIPKARLHRVVETGEAEIGRSMILDDKHRVIARIPLVKDGHVVGAAGKMMALHPKQLKDLYERIDTLEENIDYYKEEIDQVYGIRYSFDNIVGNSELVRQAKALALKAARTDASVLITGESGTGKELYAHAIHRASSRRKQNFIKVNCAAIPADLIEAELFGYESGAFTNARKQGKAGKFELAHHGTIFLDEIGDMPNNLQVKLMRVLEEKEIERIGGGRPKKIDFRVISATNRDIERLIQKSQFRLDLFYRLNVISMRLPSLREIQEDIPAIFINLLHRLTKGKSITLKDITPDAVDELKHYAWPGNIRELRNVAERALIVCNKKDHIQLEDLPIAMHQDLKRDSSWHESTLDLKTLLADTEREAVLRALKQARGSRMEAARILGIHRTGLYQKMKKYDIT